VAGAGDDLELLVVRGAHLEELARVVPERAVALGGDEERGKPLRRAGARCPKFGVTNRT
jgi:hypothetical protein